MVSLGVAMIAQNEEGHIPASISQFYTVADELVLVDGGSSDHTAMWASKLGARVAHRPFRMDFSDQKNFAISMLKTDWIYLHDPDERLEPPLIEIIPQLITEEGQRSLMAKDIIPETEGLYDCFGIPRKNFIDGVQTQVYPDYQYRLFRSYCRYQGRIHETIQNFKLRTELDYKKKPLIVPDKEIDLLDFSHISRFNILHYKSSKVQEHHEILYKKLKEGI